MKKQHIVFDTEIIGSSDPVFLVCTKVIETGVTQAFWYHKKGDVVKFNKLLEDPNYVFVGFNSIKFDAPLIAAWINGRPVETIKMMATKIIHQRMQPWESYRMAGMEGLKFDHIDLIDTAPGVMISLKTYAGRMNYPTMVDMPFHHDQDLTAKECKVLEAYCKNDLGVTEALYKRVIGEITLREQLGAEYGLDLRSKSGPQVAETILKKVVGVGKAAMTKPDSIEYELPSIIKLNNPELIHLVDKLHDQRFYIDDNGSPTLPGWMDAPLELHGGLYKFGIGGLHSQHDTRYYTEANDEWLVSDFDVASYYPTLILKCGLIPTLGGKGARLIKEYRRIYNLRLEAKNSGNKGVAATLKLALNGLYGKLGSIYSSFYAPELMLAVCLTGQLNLLNLIDRLAKQKGIEVVSANTDGITVRYQISKRDAVLKAVALNARQTGFEWEETHYTKLAMKDVNNYLALKANGEVKAKGLYAPTSLEKNPTMEVCSRAVAEYLKKGTKPEAFIKKQKDITLFVTIRGVSDGGVQHTKFTMVDDWVESEVSPGHWYRPEWPETRAMVKRKSRPKPVPVGTGGKPFGRVARWYMTTKDMPPITNAVNGNKVPKTEGAQLCMTLPDTLPADIDYQWYVDETYSILEDMGVPCTHRKATPSPN